MDQSAILSQDINVSQKQAVVALSVRGKDVEQANPDLEIIRRGRIKAMTKAQRRWLKRRQAVEPAIGHLKSDTRMQRCWLQGETGDALHALCCAVGYNLRWLMRAVLRLGLRGLLLGLLWLAHWARLLIRPCEVLSCVANPAILEVANNTLRVLLQHRHMIVRGLA